MGFPSLQIQRDIELVDMSLPIQGLTSWRLFVPGIRDHTHIHLLHSIPTNYLDTVRCITC